MIKSSFSLSETGAVREENQDSYLLDVHNGILAVADGLGGLPYGNRASQLTVDILHRKLVEQPKASLHQIVVEVNENVRQAGFNLHASGFGTTLTMARLVEDRQVFEWAHVGDSNAYHVSKGKASLLTVDHTVATRMTTQDEWRNTPHPIPVSAHHTLTQCIGQDLYIEPDTMETPFRPGDRFFLFTDGVTKSISEHILIKTLTSNNPIDSICQALSFQVEAAGSPDNYTIVAVEV